MKPNCTLTCSSFGKCEHGINPNHETGANSLLGLNNSGGEDFMHCACLDGYAGAKCEYKAIKCEGLKRYCFNGAQCAETGSQEVCDCRSTGAKLDGEHCQFEATDHCISPKSITAAAASSRFGPNKTLDVDASNPPFCVNNGICYRVTDDAMNGYFCDCDELHWTGKKCGIPVKQASHTTAPTASATDTAPPTVKASSTGQPVTASAPTRVPHHFPYHPPSPPIPSPVTPRPVATPLQPSISSAPTFGSGFGSGGISEVQNAENSSDDDGMSGGGKFGIFIFVLVVAIVVGLAGVTYYRRRASWIQRANSDGGDAPGYSDKQTDMAPFEEEGDGRQMDVTRDTSSDIDASGESTTTPRSTFSAGDEEPTMQNVQIV